MNCTRRSLPGIGFILTKPTMRPGTHRMLCVASNRTSVSLYLKPAIGFISGAAAYYCYYYYRYLHLRTPGIPSPTPEMVSFFNARTTAHIESVKLHMELMAGWKDLTLEELRQRGAEHDASKWSEPEKTPYIWHTWAHRARRLGKEFVVPDSIDINAAIEHHITTNSHHPEYHATRDAMSTLDIVEMVCDLTAMSRENGNSTCWDWVEEHAERFRGFSLSKASDFWATINELDRRLKEAGLADPSSTFKDPEKLTQNT